jgi:hypothetical protein
LVVNHENGVLWFRTNQQLTDFPFLEIIIGLDDLHLIGEYFGEGEPCGDSETEGGESNFEGVFVGEKRGSFESGEGAE